VSEQQFQDFVAAVVPSWRKSQLKVLALCVRAMVLRRSSTLSALAAPLPPDWQHQVRAPYAIAHTSIANTLAN